MKNRPAERLPVEMIKNYVLGFSIRVAKAKEEIFPEKYLQPQCLISPRISLNLMHKEFVSDLNQRAYSLLYLLSLNNSKK